LPSYLEEWDIVLGQVPHTTFTMLIRCRQVDEMGTKSVKRYIYYNHRRVGGQSAFAGSGRENWLRELSGEGNVLGGGNLSRREGSYAQILVTLVAFFT